MDTEIGKIIVPKLEALKAFISNVATAGQFLPDNQTRENYHKIYGDIKATLNDPVLEIYAPPLPHLGTTTDESTLWNKHQFLILDSGIRLIRYLESQLFIGEERKGVSSPTFSSNINIEYFQGVLGHIDKSNVTQNLELVVEKGNFESLREKLLGYGVDQNDISELRTAIKSEPNIIDQMKFGHKVGEWIGKMVQKAATGAWDISVNTAGNILAVLLLKYYGF